MLHALYSCVQNNSCACPVSLFQMELHPGQLKRACVEMAKAWRTDKYLRPLEATMIVADQVRVGSLGSG